jgi:hypothetical protein
MLKFRTPKFKKTINHLNNLAKADFQNVLRRGGEMGVAALANATPQDTGEAAMSWSYEIQRSGDQYRLIFSNGKMAGTTPLVILLQYGHGTGTGGYVPGRDFINPALAPVYDYLTESLKLEVMR